MGGLIPIAYSSPRELTSPRWCAAFAQGCGGESIEVGPLECGPVAMFGSPVLWETLQEAIRQGRTWFYGDHGYFGRGTYYRCTRNAYMHDGRGRATETRFRKFGIEVRAWAKTGSHVLVCPPGEPFAKLHGFSAQNWLRDVKRELRRHTDREIRVRTKAEARSRPLKADLRNCWALVTHMSNAALESVLFGVPVFCTGKCSALTMGLSDLSRIESPARPEGRVEWASVLADNQWTMEEMKRGDLWRAIG